METVTPYNVACPVCHGKGGFRKVKQDFLDSNWTDCGYCEGYGFVKEVMTEEECRESLEFLSYKNKIVGELFAIADVKVMSAKNIGEDLYIKVVPHKRSDWIELVKMLLKFAHHSERVSIQVKQVFNHREKDDKSSYYMFWELEILMNSLDDLDGIIDLLVMYNEVLEERIDL
jgi:hypothetical protein